MGHANNGNCGKCEELFNVYPGFDSSLKSWFKSLQTNHPEAHISCAGRGKADQELMFSRGASKAHWTQSSHNYNAAIDIFSMKDVKNIYDPKFYSDILKPALISNLKWYGEPNAPFHELPHVEISAWRDMVKAGQLKLVE